MAGKAYLPFTLSTEGSDSYLYLKTTSLLLLGKIMIPQFWHNLLLDSEQSCKH